MSKRNLVGCAVVASLAAGVTGCAHGPDSKQKSAEAVKVEKLESRIQELEKTNGRLSVRLDEMEDEVFLLQDRVEAHRLALKRRGFMNGGGGEARARAPEPTPETNYGEPRGTGRYPVRGKSGHSPEERREPAPKDGATRIPLSNQQARAQRPSHGGGAGIARERKDRTGAAESGEESAPRGRTGERRRPKSKGESEEEVVITEEDFQEFANEVDEGDSGSSGTSSGSGRSDSSSSDTSGGEAKRRVTEEKLPTGDGGPSTEAERGSGEEPDAPAPDLDEDPFSGESGLDLYKAALGKYRGGKYATALEGFEQFVSNGPREDYRDNGLYWVGECHYGLGDFEKAVDYFQRVIDEEPGGNKVPDAMLKMALAYREMGMDDRARSMLEKLTDRYPSTNAGRLGEKKLSDLKS